jgi:phytoene synthase
MGWSAPLTRDPLVEQGYAEAARVVRARAGNFYFAFLGQPSPARRALHALYAFCREADDVADDGRDGARAARDLADMRFRLDDVYDGRPRLARDLALQDTVRRYAVRRRDFLALLSGVERDLTTRRYATFEDLYRYCFEVAASVGLLCLPVFGRSDPLARRHAIDLGVGMQLVNILRDLAEDARRNRIYLPQAELQRFGVAESALVPEPQSRPGDGFLELLRFETRRARHFLQSGRSLLPLLSPAERFCPAVLSTIYSELLQQVEAQGGEVLSRRISLARPRKLWIATRIFAGLRLRKDNQGGKQKSRADARPDSYHPRA